MTGEACPACGQLPPPGHVVIATTDGAWQCGQPSTTDPPAFLTWTTLETIR